MHLVFCIFRRSAETLSPQDTSTLAKAAKAATPARLPGGKGHVGQHCVAKSASKYLLVLERFQVDKTGEARIKTDIEN